MSYNGEFEDLMDEINNIAYGYGFKNGIDWASEAQKRGEISWNQFKKYENAHNLRVRYSHGNARDISVSYETIQVVLQFKDDISYSNVRKNNGGGSSKNGGVKLPSGTFRMAPYIKEFIRKGKDGEEYYFKFAIHKEYNYLDDGYGGTHGYGYFIHIIDAPYFSYAYNRGHEFHILSGSGERYICWNKIIDDFKEANAVMFVWVNRYCDLIDVLKKDITISEEKLNARANRKNVLPAGTFRLAYFNKNSRYDNKYNKTKTINMTESVYNEILSVLGSKKPELGGMLGFTLDQDVIDTYVFDAGAKVNSVEYNPNINYLNKIIENEWEKEKIFLGGFVHSHPGNFNRLSYADVEYAQRIMEAFDMKYIFMPIVTSSFEYKTSITGYIVRINGRVERVNISVVKDRIKKDKTMGKDKKSNELEMADVNSFNDSIDLDMLRMVEAGFDAMDNKTSNNNLSSTNGNLSLDDTFARISNVIDIDYMKECSVIGIGCGGSRSFYESMARMGVGNFFLMDGDKSSYSNIASQNGYISEVGLFKPEVIKKRLLDINDKVAVKTFNCMLDDGMDDNFIEKEIISKIDIKKSIICAFTDNFFAQARVSRIALKYGIPFISGQHHFEGTVSEVVYWYPKISKYSLREIAKSRYEEYEKGYVNDVTSVGSPIFNTTRLNALCEKIALGILLYDKHPNHIYCSFLNLMKNKNLILIKQKYINQNYPLYNLFANDTNSLFDEVCWLDPESIEDLEKIDLEEGIIIDTRIIFEKKQKQ